MSVTLDQIAQAIYNALVPLTPNRATAVVGVTPTLPPVFRYLGYWSGAIPTKDETASESFGVTPFAMVSFEREQFQNNSAMLLTGDGETRCLSTWSVLVGVADPRGAGPETRGGVGTLGAFNLVNQVILAINGLRVPQMTSVLSVKIFGTPNAPTSFTQGGSIYELVYQGITYKPSVATAILDSSGAATIQVQCTQDGTQGAIGNLMPGVIMTWTANPPNLTSSAQVQGTVTAGEDGLVANQRIYYAGTRIAGRVPGRLLVMAVQFTALRDPDLVAVEKNTTDWIGIFPGNIHLKDQTDPTPPNADPLVVFQVP